MPSQLANLNRFRNTELEVTPYLEKEDDTEEMALHRKSCTYISFHW